MVASKQPTPSAKVIGRYALHGMIAAGGMATVHLGRLLGPVGFSRTVAIKRLHEHLAGDPEFVQMFIEEARLASRIKHPNVVSTLDVVFSDGELLLVLDFVLGESLARLAKAAHQAGTPPPVPILLAIMTGALYGLHAAHEARSERGEMLGIVHRDVSPQNIMVGLDGVARVLDFGVAKATRKTNYTKQGHLKGKVAYMPPEQVKGAAIDRRADVYAASVVLWEALTGLRLFDGDDDFQVANHILTSEVKPPSAYRPGLPAALDALVLRGLSRAAGDRFFTAEDMATALEGIGPLASPREVGRWVEQVSGAAIRERGRQITLIESLGIEPSSLSSGPLASEARQVAVSRAPSMVQQAPRPFVGSKPGLPRPPAPPEADRVPPRPPTPSRPDLPPIPAPLSVSEPGGVRSFQVPLPPGAVRPSFVPLAPGSPSVAGLAPVPRPPSLVQMADAAPAARAFAEPPAEDSEPIDAPDRETARPPAAEPSAAASSAPQASDHGAPPLPPLPLRASESGISLSGALTAGGETPAPLPGVIDLPGASQVSSISVVRPLGASEPPVRTARKRGLLALLALLLLVPIGAVGVWWGGGSSGTAPASSAPPSAEPSAAPLVSSAPPAEPAPPEVSAAPSATAVASAPPVVTGGERKGERKPPGRPGCNPPYTIDARGIRRLKPECL